MVSFKVYYEANITNADVLKHEIINLLKTHSRDKPNLEPGGAIYNWFTNSLMKWLTGPSDINDVEDLVGLDPHTFRPDLGEPEWMAKDDVVDFNETGNWPKMDHIIDYFNSLSDHDREKIVKKPYEQVDAEVAQWDKELAEQEKSENKLKEGTDYEVLYKDGDYTWVKLSSKEAYKCEGESMGHCVGGYDPDSENNTIISLWDKKGEPHVTIEVRNYNNGDSQEIVQIKGKQNAAPAEKYKDIAAKFVRNWMEDPEYNEIPEEPDRVVVGDGGNIGMISYDDWQGGAGPGRHYFFPDSKLWETIHKKEILPLQKDKIRSNKKAIHSDPGYGKYINGNLNLAYMYLKEIPKELKVGAVEGDLNLQSNLLTSLKNGPKEVEGDVYAGGNSIETLEGGPEIVTGDYKIAYNKLKNLKGIAKEIGGDLHIEGNPLESLDGAQDTVVLGKVYVGGWPIPDRFEPRPEPAPERGLHGDHRGTIRSAAPDFLRPDKIRDAFKAPAQGRMGLVYLPPRAQY